MLPGMYDYCILFLFNVNLLHFLVSFCKLMRSWLSGACSSLVVSSLLTPLRNHLSEGMTPQAFVVNELRRLLQHGPVPIASMPELITFEVQAVAGEIGGVTKTMASFPTIFKISSGSNPTAELVQGLFLPNSLVAPVRDELASVQIEQNKTTADFVSIRYLASRIKQTLMKKIFVLAPFQEAIRSRPDLFVFSKDGEGVALHSQMENLPSVTSLQMLHVSTNIAPRVARILLPYLPSFFISLEKLFENCPPGTRDQLKPSPFLALQEVGSQVIEVVAFGSEDHEVYARMVGTHIAYTSDEKGDLHFREFSVAALGPALVSAFQAAGKKIASINDLPEFLPPSLQKKLPLQGQASILVFQRLPHLFEVDMNGMAVRLREPMEADNMEFSVLTSPVPRALRWILQAVNKEPIPENMLVHRLPQHCIPEVRACFRSVTTFLITHRNVLYVRDGMICSLELEKRLMNPLAPKNAWNTKKHLSIDEEEIAQQIFQSLPNYPVKWTAWRSRLPPLVANCPGKDQIGWFRRFPHLFAVVEPMWANHFLIQRADLPPAKYCYRECKTVDDVLWQIAVNCCIAPTTETGILNRSSQDCRDFVKRMGGLPVLLKQFPQWFEFENRHGRPNEGLVRYIGHLSPEGKE